MTPQQLREWAADWELAGYATSVAEPFRAHAVALEEVERLKAERNAALKALDEEREDAERYRWILRQATITDFIFRFTKSRERYVSNAIDDARKTK